MRSVDVRSRTGADVRPVDAAGFFGEELPHLLSERGDLALPGARDLDPRPLAFEVDGESWTLTLGDDSIEVRHGADGAAAVVRLDTEGLHDLVNDLRTPMGFFTGGDLDMPSGRLEDFLDWSVVLRSLLDGQPRARHRRRRVPRRRRRAARPGPGLPHRRRPRADLALPRRGRVPPPRRASSPTTRWMRCPPRWTRRADRYTNGDGRSWWARTHAGEDRLVRMQYFNAESPTTATLLADDRLQSHRVVHGRRAPSRQAGRQQEPGRGPGQADRHRRGHLRRPVAQGLLAGQPLLPLLLAHRRHLRHRCRCRVRSAPRGGRLAPSADPTGVRAPRPRPAAARPAYEDGRRHRAPQLHDAHEPAAGRRASGACSTPTSACPPRRAPAPPTRPCCVASAKAHPPR